MKKSLIQGIVVAAVVMAPVVSFAQKNAPVTRAQLKSEIVRLEKSGYSPAGSDIDYPANLQAAEARTDDDERTAVKTTYGGEVVGATEAGSRAPASYRATSPYLDNAANALYVGD
ncbi:DUF4148 domain-containing protein [Trinickia soli]|uniref:DUF4148 domain-containing protein n=1 Tax=Trinickia soli TaxID=380675 RepID=A0A2N7W6K6_9BURK|nr:DUF4148 domain-containing protein [Trinickia soli]PMS25024.1 hypothetical protein C0Z19_11985 [Trinickia soli]CAB3647281.1 hypothetical protein LMG24076_00752 [Trinickia soli]